MNNQVKVNFLCHRRGCSANAALEQQLLRLLYPQHLDRKKLNIYKDILKSKTREDE